MAKFYVLIIKVPIKKITLKWKYLFKTIGVSYHENLSFMYMEMNYSLAIMCIIKLNKSKVNHKHIV
jgi:hypothetical protein